jgi:hypothetical protein
MHQTTNNTRTYSNFSHAAIVPALHVGHWDIGGTRFAVLKTHPNWFHKFMVRLLFGWKYSPETKSTTTRQLLNG